MSNKYVSKRLEIEALQWKGSNIKDMLKFYPDVLTEENENGENLIAIKTLEGVMRANVGDYIIKGTLNEYYPCKPEVFEAKYELLSKSMTL